MTEKTPLFLDGPDHLRDRMTNNTCNIISMIDRTDLGVSCPGKMRYQVCVLSLHVCNYRYYLKIAPHHAAADSFFNSSIFCIAAGVVPSQTPLWTSLSFSHH